MSRFRFILGLFPLFLLFLRAASAENVVLTWHDNTEGDRKGYRVAFGTRSGAYTEELDIADYNWTTIGGLTGGKTYYFVVKAYNTEGQESLFSNEVSAMAGTPTPTPTPKPT